MSEQTASINHWAPPYKGRWYFLRDVDSTKSITELATEIEWVLAHQDTEGKWVDAVEGLRDNRPQVQAIAFWSAREQSEVDMRTRYGPSFLRFWREDRIADLCPNCSHEATFCYIVMLGIP